MMKRIKKRSVLKTKITAYISFEAYDKLEQLSEKYGRSRSRRIETRNLAMYDALMEKQENNQATPKEATAEAVN
jgi:Txe/YoeB family toxin of Txe-Axe toxin-antitoxin module